jgi:hypothetical protein
MRNKLRLLVAAIAVLFALSAILLWSPSEPRYEGKPLTHWLQAYQIPTTPFAAASRPGRSATGRGYPPTRGEAESAIRAIGTNAGPAVPQLIEIFNRESDRDTKDWVLPVLAEIGPPAEPAVPMLLSTLSGTNAWLRENAARALGEIRADAAEVVPALIFCLRAPEPRLREASVMALRNFGKQAKAAAPALLELVRDPKLASSPNPLFISPPGVSVRIPTLGELATNALWQIDPEAATKAGMRFPW